MPFSKSPVAPGACVRFGVGERDQGQPHADEDHLVIADLPRRRDDHQFALGECLLALARSSEVEDLGAALHEGVAAQGFRVELDPSPGPFGTSIQPSRAWIGPGQERRLLVAGRETRRAAARRRSPATCRVAASSGPEVERVGAIGRFAAWASAAIFLKLRDAADLGDARLQHVARPLAARSRLNP